MARWSAPLPSSCSPTPLAPPASPAPRAPRRALRPPSDPPPASAQVSDYVMWKVQELVVADAHLLNTAPERLLIHAFEETDRQLHESSVPSEISGTTGVLCVVVGSSLYVASAGDSRCVLCRRSRSTGKFSVEPLTIDHKPDLPSERLRVETYGGYISEASPKAGPPRVWVQKGHGPGLAMARSVGDDACKCAGVVPTPEVTVRKLSHGDDEEYTLIIASDGVWEFIENEEAMAIVLEKRDASLGCAALVAEASERWRAEEGNYRDDITAIVAHLPLSPHDASLPKPPASNGHAARDRRESPFSGGSPDNSFIIKGPPADEELEASGEATGERSPSPPLAADLQQGKSDFAKRRLTIFDQPNLPNVPSPTAPTQEHDGVDGSEWTQ